MWIMLVLILAIRVKKVSHNRWFLFDSPHQLLQQMSTPVMHRAERHTTTSTDLRANRTALIRAHARGFHIIVVADTRASNERAQLLAECALDRRCVYGYKQCRQYIRSCKKGCSPGVLSMAAN